MLIRFMVENFLSYKEQNVFSMEAGRSEAHRHHICLCDGRRILRSSFVFGANAGGKSNFVKALDFGRRIVVDGVQPISMDKLHFRLCEKPNTVGVFQYDIFANGRIYAYSFAIEYKTAAIVDEALYRLDDGREICVFHRYKDDRLQLQIETDLLLTDQDKTRFEIYKEDFQGRSMRKELFLRDVAKRSNGQTEFGGDARTVADWFAKLLVIFPETRFMGLPSYLFNKAKGITFASLMSHFDTGIETLEEEEVDVEKFWEQVPPELRERLKSDIIRDLTQSKGRAITIVNNGASTFAFSYQNGQITLKKTKENHGNGQDLFERSEESDGTIRLFDLVPLYENWHQGGVVIVDEIDRSLHTKVTQEFIRIFLDDPQAKSAQLIATTHDGNLLNLDLLRRDEIWFVERGGDKATKLYSLSDFKVRVESELQKDYLLGRYGALPFFDVLEEEDEQFK